MDKTTEVVWNESYVLAKDRNSFPIGKYIGFFLGVALCFTGWGAIVGIPLILMAFFSKSKPPMGYYIGKCPACDHLLAINRAEIGFDCDVCRTRLVRNDRTLTAFKSSTL